MNEEQKFARGMMSLEVNIDNHVEFHPLSLRKFPTKMSKSENQIRSSYLWLITNLFPLYHFTSGSKLNENMSENKTREFDHSLLAMKLRY